MLNPRYREREPRRSLPLLNMSIRFANFSTILLLPQAPPLHYRWAHRERNRWVLL
jgi:hypothetical protein